MRVFEAARRVEVGREPVPFLKKLWENVRFIVRNRMYTPRFWVYLYRFVRFKILHPRVKTEGFVFLPRKYEVVVKKGAVMRIGKFVWIGRNNALRCHEGELYIGDKTVFGSDNTVNCYAGVYIGPECLFADSVYIVDFDHNYWDPEMSIRSQGISKSPVRLEGDIWVGTKVVILRGVTVGRGSVIGAMSLVNRDVPPYSIVGGVPARILGYRPRPLEGESEMEKENQKVEDEGKGCGDSGSPRGNSVPEEEIGG